MVLAITEIDHWREFMAHTHTTHGALTQAALTLGMALFGAGCAMSLPDTSRTGSIHDINIEQENAPSEASASVGDEVRFVNHRTAAIKVQFLEGDLDKVSCQRGFRSMGLMRETANISSGEAASVCFKKPGFYSYTVRMTSSVPGGEIIRTGSIQVGKVSPSPSK